MIDASTDPQDQELMELLRQQRRQRDAALAPIQAAQGNPNLGGALAGLAGGFADAVGGGKTDYAGKAIKANETASNDAMSTRLKALDEKDNTLKPLVDLAKVRASERGLDKRQEYADARQEKSIAAAMERAQTMAGGRGANLDVKTDTAASKAGHDFEGDKIIQQTKTTLNNLDRARSLLDGKEPITGKSFAVLQQDFINAMALGGAATEGKVNREMIHTAQEALNDIALRFGNVKDLRKEQPQVVANLRNLMNQVGADYKRAQSNQAKSIAANYGHVKNQKVLDTVADKLKIYSIPDEQSPAAAEATAMANQYSPDVVAYAQKHGIGLDQAQAIKAQRTGGG